MLCNICGQQAKLTDSKEIYKKSYGYIYLCSCGAYVGCHKGTTKPLGTLADKELRKLRKECHSLFDDVWKNKKMSRGQDYKKLSVYMKKDLKDTHIGMFDKKDCIKLINGFKKARK